jgi:protein-S-isoprenylcysteine O-methyltransferase Ste14
MVFWISVVVVAYLVIGFVFAVVSYVLEHGDRNDSEIMFDTFAWPLVLAAVVALIVAMGTREVGDWIIKKKGT